MTIPKETQFNHVLTFFLLLLELSTTSGTETSSPAPDPYSFKQNLSKRMAVVLIVLVAFFIFLAVVSFYTRQCSNQNYGGGLPISTAAVNSRSRAAARGLDAAVIATFPSFVYSNVKDLKIGKGSLECAVCLCEFEDDETLRLLPKCSHVFHSNCIDAWLISHSTCPVCRASLVPKPGDISFAAILNSDPGFPAPENGPVIVDVAGEDEAQIPARQNRSRSGGWRLFPRSHSTGHSLVQCERFTLRLPEEVRRELVNSNLNRARSCVVLPRMQSLRQGYRGNDNEKDIMISSRSGRSDWRTFFPVLRKDGSRSQTDDCNGGNRPFVRLRPDSDGQGQL